MRTPRGGPGPGRSAGRASDLIVGLGNPLAGDDGIAWYVLRALGRDRRLPASVEPLWGGTDLLRHEEALRGRRRIWLLDAVVGAGSKPEVFEPAAVEQGPPHAHHLSPVAALTLLSAVGADFGRPEVRIIGLPVRGVRAGEGLSAEARRRVPGLVEGVLEVLRDAVAP